MPRSRFVEMMSLIPAAIAGFSQDPAPAPAISTAAPASEATGTTLPVARTLTSADDHTIEVTILSKSKAAIKAKCADGKEFEITSFRGLPGRSEAPRKRAICFSSTYKPRKIPEACVLCRSQLQRV